MISEPDRDKLATMKRPLLSHLLPDLLKQSLYYRLYCTRHADWMGLFETAPLALTPHVAMYGLLPNDVISGNIAFNGFYELALSRQIFRLARKGGTFLDVGANMGYFSLLWAGANSSNRVVAFEAAPRNVAIMENNVCQNHFSERITLVAKAAGNRSSMIPFDVGPADMTGWGGISSESSSTTIDVPMVRLDEELPDQQIDVLKIDVEGADAWVLFGCEALLKKKRIRTIFFEQNKKRMKQLGIEEGEILAFLRDYDYTCIPFGRVDEGWIARPNV